MNFLIYVYCILDQGDPAVALLEGGAIPGVAPGCPLFPVQANDLVAAVSRVPSLQFDEQPLNEITASLSAVAPYALKHHEAIARLMTAASALVPMTMGAIYRSEARVEDLLRERGGEFAGLLTSVRGREEWGIKVYRQAGLLLDTAAASSEQAQAMEAAAAAATPGKAYLIRRQRERVLESEAERIAVEGVRSILEALRAASDDAREENLPAVEREGPKLTAKASFLVARDRAEQFRSVVDQLSTRFARKGLSVDIDGPWAPYSFVALKSMAGRA